MNFTGKWAQTGKLDIQLDILDSGEVFVSDSMLGEYGVKAVAEFSGNKLKLTAKTVKNEILGELDLSENELRGKLFCNGTEYKGLFRKTPVMAERLSYHYANYDIKSSDGFAMTFAELIGVWKSEELFGGVELVISEASCGISVDVSFDGVTTLRGCLRAAYIDDCELVWLINDAWNRGVCRLHIENGELVGSYKQIHRTDYPSVVFKKVSDTPKELREDEVPEANVPKPDGSRLEILCDYADYESGGDKIETEYHLGTDEVSEKTFEELEKYGYSGYIKDKSGDDLAFACLDFICDHFAHKGDSGMPPWQTRSLCDFLVWCGEHDGKTNCRGLSIMLSDILRYNGIKAQHVTCMPFEDPFYDCHVVVDCHLPSGKRVMLDPTYRLYLTDSLGEYVSLPQLREMLISGGKLVPNETAAYTGDPENGFDIDGYREYMSKNTVRFSKGVIAEDGNDDYEQMLLFPKRYPYEKVTDPNGKNIRFDSSLFWGEL